MSGGNDSSSSERLQHRGGNRVPLLAIFIFLFHFNEFFFLSKDNSARENFQISMEPEDEVIELKKRHRLAVAQFIDNPSHLYGAYSVKNQMKKFNMTSAQSVSLVAVAPDDFPAKFVDAWGIMNEWFDDIRLVNKSFIHDRLDEGLWKGTFNKLWLFNLTDYDKVIVLDADIMIRQSLLHWFDYDTPCATQPVGAITWNSGAMVITPNSAIFDQMMSVLPEVKAYRSGLESDNWNTWIGQQGFMSAFFTHAGSQWRMKTMPLQSSILSKTLAQTQGYWIKHRMHVFETVHMTTVKPWQDTTKPKDKRVCGILREWKASVSGIDMYYPKLAPLEHDFLQNCLD